MSEKEQEKTNGGMSWWINNNKKCLLVLSYLVCWGRKRKIHQTWGRCRVDRTDTDRYPKQERFRKGRRVTLNKWYRVGRMHYNYYDYILCLRTPSCPPCATNCRK